MNKARAHLLDPIQGHPHSLFVSVYLCLFYPRGTHLSTNCFVTDLIHGSASGAQVLAQYYAREGYYNKAQTLCNEEARRTNDIPLHLWKAYALHCEGSTREAIFEAEACLGKRDMGLPFASALAFFHNQLGTVDQDAVRDMNVRASQELHHAPEAAKLLTVRFYTMVGETEKGQEVLGSMDDIDSAAANAVRGWNAFVAGKKANAASGKTSNAFLEQCGQFFDAATGSGTELENLDALMGKAKVLEGKRQWAQALDCLNKVIVMHDWFLPALMEKAKTLMMTADWDQALEAAGRLQQQEPNNIEALRLNVLFLLSRESRCDAAAERLQELVAAMQQLEPHNYDLVLSCAQLFSRLAGRHKSILNITFSMMKRVTDAAPEQAKYLTELGYQYMMQAELSKAEQTFHSAVAKDETDVRALFGIINCRVQEGSLDDAEEQLEFLSEIQISVGKSPDLAFLQSLIAWRKRRDAEGALNLLNETLTLHITNFKSAVGYDFFIKLNADFMLEIAREYLQHTISGGDDAAKPGGYLLRGVQVLETLTRFVPGLVPAQVLLAKAKVALNEVDVATRILHQCLRLDPSCADTYLLLDQQNAALQYLEQGLSHDFSVRSHPLYYLVKAEVLSAAGEVDQASKLLEQAMALPGVKSDSKKSAVQLSQADRCSLFTLHVNLLTKLKQLDQASEVVKTAIAEFAGTPEEVKILVANSQLAIEKGEIDQALNMLRTMKPDHPQFAMAKAAMADIYLKHRKDKKAYARCYKAIVDHAPTVQNYLILGDALLSIQEPADAIIAFQQAMDIDSHKDPGLVRKIGKAMMQTHDYDRKLGPSSLDMNVTVQLRLWQDHNRSCGKAWEQLGLIYEKEQAYKDAASHYEKAWEFCNEASPAVGYRLAFNYLKAKSAWPALRADGYVPAINVCQSVLKISENYPKIKKDGVALLVAAVLLLLLLFTRTIFIDVGSRDGLLLASGAASQPGKEPLAAVAVARQARSLSSCASLPASVLRDVQHVALVHRGVWRCLHISSVTKYSDFHVWLEAGDGSGVRVQGSKVFLRQGWLGDEEAVESVEDFGLNSSTAVSPTAYFDIVLNG
ncbi:unnamed protein product [Effrenium voratum]|nr:unnamed protein product [Effrenium voratum]